ncbi:hypothetical protein cypCar_00030831, partial [Cyprinus carpio]
LDFCHLCQLSVMGRTRGTSREKERGMMPGSAVSVQAYLKPQMTGSTDQPVPAMA